VNHGTDVNKLPFDSAKMTKLRNYYNGLDDDDARRRRPMGGQKIAYAPPTKPGDTAVETSSLLFGANKNGAFATANTLRSSQQPRFYPKMTQAAVRLSAVEQIRGPLSPTEVMIHPHYVANGFGSDNKVGAFLETVDTVALNFGGSGGGAELSGGVATPNMGINGLSKELGPLSGDVTLDLLKDGKFDPEKFFQGFSAKILGGIDLWDIIKAVTLAFGDTPGAGAGPGDIRAPVLTTEVIYPGNDKTKPPEAIRTQLRWEPEVKSDPLEIFKATDGVTQLTLEVVALTKLASPGSPEITIRGTLTDFSVVLIGTVRNFIEVVFDKLEFVSVNGGKPDITPDITEVIFSEELEFIKKLQEYLSTFNKSGASPPPGPGDSGAAIDITPTGIRANYTLALPTIAVGVLTLENISFSAGFELPFTGEPVRFRFAFCERENQFHLIVYFLGGGGFFGIAIGVDGVELLEAAFEFGAQASIDLGVASGGLHIFAGIYFKMEQEGTEDTLELTGYLRMGGEVCVLGIISASIELNMSFTYLKEGNKTQVLGQASIIVEIEVLFFSASVEIKAERRFAGSDAAGALPPGIPAGAGFDTLISQAQWNTYCDAFA
jgi:hypothetical protein